KFAGKTIVLRFAAVNNKGQLLVGVTGVKLVAKFTDTLPPIITGLVLRNPGVGGGNTTDPTIVGQVNDDNLSPANAFSPPLGEPNNIKKIIFDTANDGDFNGTDDFAINNWDPLGNFTISLPSLGQFLDLTTQLLPGTYAIGVEALDRGGNTFKTAITFTFQGPDPNSWRADGPGATNVQGQSPTIKYSTISGWITSIIADPRDQEGNTYYVWTMNGGVWKSTDGGNDWTPLTDFVTDSSGNPLATPIGAMAIFVDPNNPTTGTAIYAGTGVASNAVDARDGIGILKSLDNGKTWTLVGQSVFGPDASWA